jgi:hypothetical protein
LDRYRYHVISFRFALPDEVCHAGLTALHQQLQHHGNPLVSRFSAVLIDNEMQAGVLD